jgi:hypothetical protein
MFFKLGNTYLPANAINSIECNDTDCHVQASGGPYHLTGDEAKAVLAFAAANCVNAPVKAEDKPLVPLAKTKQ